MCSLEAKRLSDLAGPSRRWAIQWVLPPAGHLICLSVVVSVLDPIPPGLASCILKHTHTHVHWSNQLHSRDTRKFRQPEGAVPPPTAVLQTFSELAT